MPSISHRWPGDRSNTTNSQHHRQMPLPGQNLPIMLPSRLPGHLIYHQYPSSALLRQLFPIHCYHALRLASQDPESVNSLVLLKLPRGRTRKKGSRWLSTLQMKLVDLLLSSDLSTLRNLCNGLTIFYSRNVTDNSIVRGGASHNYPPKAGSFISISVHTESHTPR